MILDIYRTSSRIVLPRDVARPRTGESARLRGAKLFDSICASPKWIRSATMAGYLAAQSAAGGDRAGRPPRSWRGSPTRWRNSAQHPQRFPAFVAAVSLDDVDGPQGGRARDRHSAHAVSNLPYRRPSAGRGTRPVFAAMADDLPIWLHPPASRCATTRRKKIVSRCGGAWLALRDERRDGAWSSGVFDRHPGLKIVTHHLGGGMILFFDGRIGAGMEGNSARAHLGRGSCERPLLVEAAASGLLPQGSTRHRAVRRRRRGAHQRPRLLRHGPRRVRDRRATRVERQNHCGGGCARSRACDAPQDHAGKRQAAVEPAAR